MSGFISFLHMCDDEVSILLKMRSCCIEGTERKGNKEDIAFITLARSHGPSEKLAKQMKKLPRRHLRTFEVLMVHK
jgi:hypothetical protein